MDNNRIGVALTAQLETGTACSGAGTYGSRLTGVASVIRGSTGGVTSELANSSRKKKRYYWLLAILPDITDRELHLE